MDTSGDQVVSFLGIPSSHLAPVAVFVSYFVLIACLFSLVIPRTLGASYASIKSQSQDRRCRRYAAIFGLLTLGSQLHTWYHMIGYMRWSYTNFYQTLPASPSPSLRAISFWLLNTSLFTEAWSIVLQPGTPFWISDHITRFTCCWWTFFVYLSIQRPAPLSSKSSGSSSHLYGSKVGKDKAGQPESSSLTSLKDEKWGNASAAAVLLLGQVVAISVASNIWFVGCVKRGFPIVGDGRVRDVPVKVWGALLGSSICVGVMPLTVNQPSFLTVLLIMHALLFVPFLPTRLADGPSSFTLTPTQVSLLLLVPPVVSSMLFNLPILTSPSVALRTFLAGNHALRSIGSDAAWCAFGLVAWASWKVKGPGKISRIVCSLGAFWVGGVGLPLGLD